MLDDILEFIFHLVVEIFFFYSGEIILYLLTFGRRKPRWDYYTEERASKFVILTEISMWIGMLAWLLIAAALVNAFLLT
jgi:hypothetical protein